ncbi:leucine zipper putative tumor suppressor 2 homolog isoform X2 [Lycorma delicatula]|uniref:leucine zipper putative tumor suppressor 2 homolog isoform X2 n=1 Tax=Lycorma delicatula TaxID=130591 RepID=UPI003F51705D
MARVDSGNETLFSGDSSPDTPCSNNSDRTPPRITGSLTKGKVVIRPVAFKPVPTAARFTNAGEHYGSTPILTRPGSHLTLYGSSNDLRHTHGSNSNYSLDRKLRSSPPLAMSSLPLTSSLLGYDSLESVRKSPASSRNGRINSRLLASEGSGSLVDLTPSPCESGVMAELEAALRERDSEVAYLRQTMEHNEQVIFRVYQEKERAWEREMRRVKALHENRLRTATQKSHKLEQMLMMQTYQLQQDKKRLREEGERAEREGGELRQEVELLRGRLEETEWGLCQKSGELALLKSQLKETQGEQANKGHEVVSLRSEIRELRLLLEQRDLEIATLRSEMDENSRHHKQLQEQYVIETNKLKLDIEELEAKLALINVPESKENSEIVEEDKIKNVDVKEKRYEEELELLKKELAEEQMEWERERLQWAQEKEKVLSYQRQLQLNYIQMYRRTRTLEAELESLKLELDLDSKTRRKKQISLPQTAIQL